MIDRIDMRGNPSPNKVLQLTWTARSKRNRIAFWHQPWVPRRPSAACATQLSAQSARPHKEEEIRWEFSRGSCSAL